MTAPPPPHRPAPHHRELADLLGAPPDATAAELTRAYRRAAMRWHPDRQPNNPAATQHFQKIQNAYRTLLQHARPDTTHLTAAQWETLFNDIGETAPEDWRADIPRQSITVLGIAAVIAVLMPRVWLGIVVFSAALVLATQVYLPPKSAPGIRAEKIFKQSVRLYFLFLLAAAVITLAARF